MNQVDIFGAGARRYQITASIEVAAELFKKSVAFVHRLFSLLNEFFYPEFDVVDDKPLVALLSVVVVPDLCMVPEWGDKGFQGRRNSRNSKNQRRRGNVHHLNRDQRGTQIRQRGPVEASEVDSVSPSGCACHFGRTNRCILEQRSNNLITAPFFRNGSRLFESLRLFKLKVGYQKCRRNCANCAYSLNPRRPFGLIEVRGKTPKNKVGNRACNKQETQNVGIVQPFGNCCHNGILS